MPPTPVRSSCGSIRMQQCAHHTLMRSVIGILAFSTFISTSWFHSAHLAARSLAIMEQQVPNERLNNKCSDHDTFHRSVHRTTTSIVSLVRTLAWLLATEMERVSQVLQFAIVIQRSWLPPISGTQLFQKVDFLWSRISAKRTIFQEFL